MDPRNKCGDDNRLCDVTPALAGVHDKLRRDGYQLSLA